ncbi:MAG: LPXTG cell wall anchor domain-containing protein, partial [Eubacteriales bacterium]|nr:LPXTG cell wall anchor domain-containing protein [Eubacteriales bacterium]
KPEKPQTPDNPETPDRPETQETVEKEKTDNGRVIRKKITTASPETVSVSGSPKTGDETNILVPAAIMVLAAAAAAVLLVIRRR